MDLMNLYYASETNLNGRVLHPVFPTISHAASDTPRICFSTSISGALSMIGSDLTGKTLYIHRPVHQSLLSIAPNDEIIAEGVHEAFYTGETWILEDVQLELDCIVKVTRSKLLRHSYDGKEIQIYAHDWETCDEPGGSVSVTEMKKNMIIVSLCPWTNDNDMDDYEVATVKALQHKPLISFMPYFLKAAYPDFFMLLESYAPGGLHYPMLDWDEKVNVYERLRETDMSGHIYSTYNGYHFYGDSPMKFSDIYLRGKYMGCCERYLDIAKKRGCFGLRCGRKKDRPYRDIRYIGHTSGVVTAKPLILKVKDAIDNRLELLYDGKNLFRGARCEY